MKSCPKMNAYLGILPKKIAELLRGLIYFPNLIESLRNQKIGLELQRSTLRDRTEDSHETVQLRVLVKSLLNTELKMQTKGKNFHGPKR
jgi:hypothetical protein